MSFMSTGNAGEFIQTVVMMGITSVKMSRQSVISYFPVYSTKLFLLSLWLKVNGFHSANFTRDEKQDGKCTARRDLCS